MPSPVTLYDNGFILIPPLAGERTGCPFTVNPLPTRESYRFTYDIGVKEVFPVNLDQDLE
jgi:hypothetical protein